MINGEILGMKIKWLEKEITALKTTHIKTATKISTLEKTTSVNFTLTMPDPYTMVGSKRAIITMTTTDGTDMISACYLDGLTPSNLNDRYPFIYRLDSPAGQAKYEVVVLSQNANDYQTLSGGGTVNLSYNLKLVGSSDYNLTVEYRNILGGSS